jgi:hypothetical protein
LVVLFALGVIAVVAFALWRLGGDDSVEPLATGTDSTTSTAPTTAPTTETTKPKPKPTGSCDGPTTQFNVEGTEQDSLLPDCGVAAPVTRQQQKKSGLGLACGGSYPVILYKTTTTDAKTSICGKNSSGESFRLVTKPSGGKVVDLPGSYDPQLDAFVASKNGTTYTVLGVDGTLEVRKNGSTTKQKSSEWISLDNESDYD